MVVLAGIPSTSVSLVVTRSATLGIRNGMAVSAGIVLGDLAFIALAISGLSVVAEQMGSLATGGVLFGAGGCLILKA
ncbi:LysE family transporter [Thiolapillus sp.]